MRRVFYTMMLFGLLGLGWFALGQPAYAQEPQELEGDRDIIGETFTLSAGDVLDGDLNVVAGMATIEAGAVVEGDVVLIGGTLQIDGNIEGNVNAFGGTLNLGNTSVIDGDLTVLGGSINQENGSLVRGKTFSPTSEMSHPEPPLVPPSPMAPMEPRRSGNFVVNGIFWIIGTIVETVIFGLVAMVVALYLPRHLRTTAATVSKAPAPSTGVGCMGLTVMAITMFVAAITIIGIPITLVLGLVGGVALLYGFLAVGMVFGDFLLRKAAVRNPRPAAAAAIGTGALVLSHSFLSLIPCVGAIGTLALAGLSVGAVILSRFGTQRYPVMAAVGPVWEEPIIGPLPGQFFNRGAGTPGAEKPRAVDSLFADMTADDDMDIIDPWADDPRWRPDRSDDRPNNPKL